MSGDVRPKFRVGPRQEFGEVATREEAVLLFRNWWFWPMKWALPKPPFDALHELRGKDLACWCPLDAPCHADVLLEADPGWMPVETGEQ